MRYAWLNSAGAVLTDSGPRPHHSSVTTTSYPSPKLARVSARGISPPPASQCRSCRKAAVSRRSGHSNGGDDPEARVTGEASPDRSIGRQSTTVRCCTQARTRGHAARRTACPVRAPNSGHQTGARPTPNAGWLAVSVDGGPAQSTHRLHVVAIRGDRGLAAFHDWELPPAGTSR